VPHVTIRFRSALFFLAAAATAHAEWAIVSAESEPGSARVVHRRVILEDSITGQHANFDLAIFSAKSCTLRVIDNPDGRLASIMKREKYVCGVNGGYFDEEFKSIGLRIVNGQVIAPLRRARLITGVLLASPSGVQIVRAREFSRPQKISAAIQCGPLLVDASRSVRGLNDSARARRTFAATGTSERVLLGVSSEVSLAELATILATIQIAGDVKIERALNLDGGSSSAFWFARENGSAFSIPEQKSVRDFVGVLPK
jgi:exopolysaccharide biosynthesis protein